MKKSITLQNQGSPTTVDIKTTVFRSKCGEREEEEEEEDPNVGFCFENTENTYQVHGRE